MKRSFVSATAIAAAAFSLVGAQAAAEDYIIISNGNNAGLASQVAAAGGTLSKTYDFGVAVASSDDPAFAEALYDTSNVQ